MYLTLTLAVKHRIKLIKSDRFRRLFNVKPTVDNKIPKYFRDRSTSRRPMSANVTTARTPKNNKPRKYLSNDHLSYRQDDGHHQILFSSENEEEPSNTGRQVAYKNHI